MGQNLWTNTLLSAFGLGNGWVESLPVIACTAVALWAGLSVRASGAAAAANDAWVALAALVAWFGIAISAPALWHVPAVITGDSGALALFATGGVTGLVFLAAVAWRSRNVRDADGTPTSALQRRDPIQDHAATHVA
jgi:hypothetical protein